MKRKLIATFSFLAVVVILLLLTACKTDAIEEKKTFRVKMCTGYLNDPYETWSGIESITVSNGYVGFIDKRGKWIRIIGGPTVVEEE